MIQPECQSDENVIDGRSVRMYINGQYKRLFD